MVRMAASRRRIRCDGLLIWAESAKNYSQNLPPGPTHLEMPVVTRARPSPVTAIGNSV